MKNIQKLLWLLVFSLSASLYAADWTGSRSEPKSTKEIDGKTFYVITSAEELAWFAAQVNGGKTTINALLANDIQFMDDTSKTSSVNWTPIGKDSTVMFNGTFDGAGCSVYGLWSRQGKFAGLLGVTGKTAVVKNVTLKFGDIEAINGTAYAGGIVSYNSGLVSKCTNHSSVSFSSNFKGGVSGGIVGENAGTVKGCRNSGSVSASAFYPAHSGGIVGWNSGTVIGCVNSGLVSASSMSSHSQGDICGINRGSIIDASDIYFSIRFFDSDTTLLDSQYVQYGRTPSYSGTPTKASTAQYSYAFEGWHVEPTAATEDFDYYAVYSETLRSYTVRFLDFDGSELQSSTYLYGATPGVSKVPARESTVAYDYAFSGWTPAVEAVTGDAIYTALYDSSKVLYTVTFMDGSSVFATVRVPYGGTAKAPGTPSREGYKFVGWNGSLSNVTGGVTVSALFEELVYREVVIDRGDDGMDTVKVEEDEWFTLLEDPEKPGHTFTGWYGPDGDYLGKAGDSVKVSADMRIEPRYEANLYKIAFVNGSDTLQDGEAAYGTLPSYEGATPTRASSAKYTYTFAGWKPAIDTVKEPTTYTAIFDSTEIPLSSSSVVSSSSGESSSSAGSSGSSAKSSSSSAGKNSSSSTELSDALVANIPAPTWSVTVSGRNFLVHAAPVGKAYALFDLQGKVLAKGRIENSEMALSAPRAGCYIVRVGNNSVRVNAK